MEKEIRKTPSMAMILEFERKLSKFPQLKIETKHYFSEGLYAREIFIPKGVLLTGEIHKTEHLSIVSKGKIRILTEEGMSEIEAPCTLVSKVNTKRVGYALEDTVWITIHKNEDDTQELEVLKERLIDSNNLKKLETT